MLELKTKIQIIEDKYLADLTSYCESIFQKVRIPSHDHSHHKRVWEFSKEILFALSNSYNLDSDFIESCLIAAMFHDTGLVINVGVNHGLESRKICQDYFNKRRNSKPKNLDDILNAIEKHDDKEYTQKGLNPDSLLSILCNADDLDAFGKTGVVRYTEIYLMRGTSLKALPQSVIRNLDNRFKNFENTYKQFPALYQKHKERYLLTRNFFVELEKE